MRALTRIFAFGFPLGAVVLTVLACGTDPVGVETCRKIETARCQNAPACGIDLSVPTHNDESSPEKSVAACIRYYDDACLHGLAAPTDPAGPTVQACVDAINTADCTVVKAPETAPACAFLIPPAAPAAAPADAAVDTATE
jgi:hypothetical protein